MNIRIFDFDGNLLGYSDKIISAYRNAKFCDIGSSEFHIDKTDPLAGVILSEKYLLLEQDGVFQDIIIGSKSDDDFAIYCRSLSWLLSKMIIPPISVSGNAESIVSYLLDSSFGGDISLGNCASFSESFDFETGEVTYFSDSLKSCLAPFNAGFSVRFDHSGNSLFLDILKGNELPLYVSENDCTLESASLSEDILDLANSACYKHHFTVLGTWNPRTNSPYLSDKVSSNMGICYRVSFSSDSYSRFDITWTPGDYIYCNTEDGKLKGSSERPDDFYVYIPCGSCDPKFQWFCISDCNSNAETSSFLANIKASRRFDAKAKNLKFMKDYSLGDFVKVQYFNGSETISVRCRFTEIIINHDSSGFSENPILEEVI